MTKKLWGGRFSKKARVISAKNVLAALGDILKNKKELFALNKKAFERGNSVK